MKLIKQILIGSSVLLLLHCRSVQSVDANAYQSDKHRPQFHFSPKKSWMNDPNGMFYWRGTYHLFYQYYPDSTVWGPMHWGHATSTDLMRWQHAPIALFPDSIGYIFSGSVVVDSLNTSGFARTRGEVPMVAIFTYHNIDGERGGRTDFQTQGIAFSLDEGKTWIKYAQNPVIKNTGIKDFRDPKVMWHGASAHWVMTLAVADHVEFWRSKNLKNWEKTSEFGKNEGAHGGVWECPDLFPIRVEGENLEKYVLIQSIGNGSPNGGSGTQYFVGDFDGKNFKNDRPADNIYWFDYGCDNYAGVTWHNAPNRRHLFLAWLSNWQYAQKVPTQRWRSAMTLPRELHLQRQKNGELRLVQNPVIELERWTEKPTELTPNLIKNRFDLPVKKASAMDLTIKWTKKDMTADIWGIELKNSIGERLDIGFDRKANQYVIDRANSGQTDFDPNFAKKHQVAPVQSDDDEMELRIIVDESSVELFADNGLTAMSAVYFTNQKWTSASILTENGNVVVKKIKISYIRPTW